jgi:FkbM family methyltransferase
MNSEIALQLTEEARAALPGIDIELLWDDLWIWRVGPHYFPDTGIDDHSRPDFQKIASRPTKHIRDVNDYWFHVYAPKPGDVIVDIGAGRGEDVFAFSPAVGTSGRVWAIEPHPVSFAALKKLCKWNSLTNVHTLNYACVEQSEQLQVETLPVWESNYVYRGEPTPTSHSVDGVRFDDLAATMGIEQIDFLKMNIEGAERHALPGCVEAIRRTRAVCVAAHDFRANRGEGEHFRTMAFVRDFLTEAGFELITRDDDPRYYVPYHVHGVRP